MSSRGRGGRRRGGGHHEEEHENHERWLVSYADMVTLLMVLFIVMFAISQVDQRKFMALKDGIASGFGSELNVVTMGGTGITPDAGTVPLPLDLAGQVGAGPQDPTTETEDDAGRGPSEALAEVDRTVEQARAELAELTALRDRLAAALEAKGLEQSVRLEITERGLDIVLVADELFFANASATLKDPGEEVLDAVAPVLRDVPEQISVEGHANHLAVRGGPFPSNWELSAARAGSVVRYLQAAHRMPADRMSATGYADTRPLVPKDDPQALTRNRRVDVLLVSDAPPQVRELLPVLAEDG